MRRLLLLLLLHAVLAGPALALQPDQHETLAAALAALRTGRDEAAARSATAVLDGIDAFAPGTTGLFSDLLAQVPLTEEPCRFLGDYALRNAAPARRRPLQEALAAAAAGEIDAALRSALPGRFASELPVGGPRFEHLRGSMALLGRIAFEGDLSPGARTELYRRLRGVVAAHPGVLRNDVRVDPTTHPGLPAIRGQLQKNLQDLLVPFDAARFVTDAGFVGERAELVRNHGVLVLDNGGLDTRQLRAIREVLALIPPELHRTRHISVHDLLANRDGDRVIVPLVGSPGVNLFDLAIGSHLENAFPADVGPVRVQGFCAVLQHELNHMVDACSVSGVPARARRRDQLIARAGSDPQQYLRSMFEPGFFVAYPQEFFASIANAYFTDSFHTLSLGIKRFENGDREPINQFLFFAEVYSRGRGFVPFIVQSAECEYSLFPIPIGRDDRGRIDRIELPGATLRFVLDEEGNVVR
jgi:hypothetical protein